MNTRRERRADIAGELLPALPEESRALVPVNQTGPLLRIRLPEARADDAPLLEHEIKRPVRPPTMESDVAVPFAQAAITAVAVAVCVGMLAWALHWSWRAVAVAFGLALAGAWLARLRLVDALLWEVERFTGHDINHDGQVGQPSFAPVIVNPLEARTEAAQLQRTNETQSELHDLLGFVTRCANLGCSESKQNIGTSPSARAEFAKRRDTLIALGIGRWKDPDNRRNGWELSVSPAQAGVILRKHLLDRGD